MKVWLQMVFGVAVAAFCAAAVIDAAFAADGEPALRDPAAWGSDHVGEPMPALVDGNQCLFCHRNEVGAWNENQHQITIRLAEDDKAPMEALAASDTVSTSAESVGFLLGVGEHARFLRRGEGYGKMDLLNAMWDGTENDGSITLVHGSEPHWDADIFGASCAGCHTSGVDSRDQTFTAVALDCYTCHGTVPDDHTEQPELALFAKTREHDPRVITATCSACHLRGGESKSTGLPYPNNFVPGDNLFKDFKVDLSEESIANMDDLGDRHVYENVRDVMLLGKDSVTCISCHDIHGNSSAKHARVKRSDRCFTCHYQEGAADITKPYERHSATCQY